MIILTVNLTYARVTWEGSLSEGLSRLDCSVDMPIWNFFLIGLIKGRPTLNVSSIILQVWVLDSTSIEDGNYWLQCLAVASPQR